MKTLTLRQALKAVAPERNGVRALAARIRAKKDEAPMLAICNETVAQMYASGDRIVAAMEKVRDGR